MTSIQIFKNKLRNIPCFILGNSPSLNSVDLQRLENHFTIGINRVFLKHVPTVLFWQDISVYNDSKVDIDKLNCIKVARNAAAGSSKSYRFNTSIAIGRPYSDGNFALPIHSNNLYGGGTSAPLAFQLAYLMGCSPIILVGVDCKYGKNGETDFYGVNNRHHSKTIPYCEQGLAWMVKTSKDAGIPLHSVSESCCFKSKPAENQLRKSTLKVLLSTLPEGIGQKELRYRLTTPAHLLRLQNGNPKAEATVQHSPTDSKGHTEILGEHHQSS